MDNTPVTIVYAVMFQFQDGSIKWQMRKEGELHPRMFQFQDGSIKWRKLSKHWSLD